MLSPNIITMFNITGALHTSLAMQQKHCGTPSQRRKSIAIPPHNAKNIFFYNVLHFCFRFFSAQKCFKQLNKINTNRSVTLPSNYEKKNRKSRSLVAIIFFGALCTPTQVPRPSPALSRQKQCFF